MEKTAAYPSRASFLPDPKIQKLRNGQTNPVSRDFSNDTVVLRWYGQGFMLTYYLSKSNPDWRFLDTWYLYEVKDLYRMNQGNPLSESLFAYLCSRIDT